MYFFLLKLVYVVKLDIVIVGKLYIYIYKSLRLLKKEGFFDVKFGGIYYKRNRIIEELIIIWLKFGSFVI